LRKSFAIYQLRGLFLMHKILAAITSLPFIFAVIACPLHAGEKDDAKAAERAMIAKICKDPLLKAAAIKHGEENESESFKPIVAWDMEVACAQAELSPTPIHDAADPSPEGGHSHWVTGTAFSSDGTKIVSSSFDGTVRVWDVATGKPLTRIEAGDIIRNAAGADARSRVRSAHFISPTEIVAGADNTPVRVYDAATGEKKGEISFVKRDKDHLFPPSMAVTSTGLLILGGNADDVIVYDWPSKKESFRLPGHTTNVWSVAVTEAASLIATGSDGDAQKDLARIQLWRLDSGKKIGEFMAEGDDTPQGLAFSPDGKRLAVLVGGMIQIHAVEGFNKIGSIKVHPKFSSSSLTFTADGKGIISCMRHPILWNAETGKRVLHFGPFNDLCHSVRLSPNGKYAVTGSMGSDVRIWEVETGTFFRRLGQNVHPPG